MADTEKIHESMIQILGDIEAISKARNNAQQGYKFRGIDDVYNEVHNLFAKHKIYMTTTVIDHKREERTSKSGNLLIYSVLTCDFTFHAIDGSSITSRIVGEGMDSGDKATNKALSVAQKYCLLQAFCIPTEESKDSENDSHDILPKIPATNSAKISHEEFIAPMPQREPGEDDAFEKAINSGISSNQNESGDDRLISEPQAKRLFALMKEAGKSTEDVKAIIGKYGYQHSRDIKRKNYAAICDEVSKPKV